jgi:hypothetical protein
MEDLTHKTHIARKYVHKRLLVQLVIFAIVSVVLFGVVVFDVLQSNINLIWIALGIVVGLGVGLAAGRMFSIKWHEDTQKVVMGMDKMGFVVLALYILFRSFGDSFLSNYIHGPTLSAFTFSMLDGIMVGRLLSMYRSIEKILQEQHILKS